MTERKPIYISLNNSLVDLSQITAIQRIVAPTGIAPRILLYIGKEVAFTFTFKSNDNAESAFDHITETLNDALEDNHTYVVDCDPDAEDEDDEPEQEDK